MKEPGNKAYSTPFLNWLVIVASAAGATIIFFSGELYSQQVKDAYGVLPESRSPLPYFTGSFLYPDPFLLAVCMFYLWMVGGSIERRAGHIFYLVLYFGGFACGALAYALTRQESQIPSVGAAGAIAAMLGAHVARLPEVRTSAKVRVPPGNSLWLVLIWALFQILYAVDYESAGASGAALSTNLGGFTFGVLAAAVALKFTHAAAPEAAATKKPATQPSARDAAAVEHLPRIISPATSPAGDAGGGRFAIFRQSLGPLDISAVGRTIALMLKTPLADVTTRLYACSGYLADSLDEGQAAALRHEIDEMNIPVFTVRQELLRELPEPELAQEAACDAEGLKVKLTDRVETISWDSILAANAGILESWRSVEVPEDPEDGGKKRTALGFGPRRKRTRLVKEVQQKTVLDVLLREPWRRIRLQEDYTGFNLMADRRKPTAAENLAAVAKELAGHSDVFLVGDGAAALGAGSGMGGFTYDNRRKYDLVNFWLAHKALYDIPANEVHE